MNCDLNPRPIISATKFLCVKTFSDKVVAEPFSYLTVYIFIIEIVHKVHTQLKIKKKKIKVNWHRETEYRCWQ